MSVVPGSVTETSCICEVQYSAPPGYTNTDSFTYTVSDGHCGGTAAGTVTVQINTNSSPTGNFTIQLLGDGSVLLTFAGAPGFTYRIQYTESLITPNWQDLATRIADQFGEYIYIDSPPPGAPARYYRSVWQPQAPGDR